MRLRFLSRNSHKIREAETILEPAGVEIVPVNLAIDEIQTADTRKLVHDKCLRAFSQIGHPLFVEHTGLYMSSLNGFPGGLTQVFWDTLGAQRFTEIFGRLLDRKVIAKTIVAYCDGKRVHYFEGAVSGTIAKQPRGNRDFQWDCVFVPDGYSKTFAELGPVKNSISMRRLALDCLTSFLRTGSQ